MEMSYVIFVCRGRLGRSKLSLSAQGCGHAGLCLFYYGSTLKYKQDQKNDYTKRTHEVVFIFLHVFQRVRKVF